MLSRRRSVLSVLIALLYCSAASALTNLTFVKQELENYHDSGRYFTEIKAVTRSAEQNLISQVQSHPKQAKLAIVLDIDDTAISNYNDLKNNDFAANYAMRLQALQKGDQPPITAVLSLYKLALHKQVNIFFITGRPTDVKDITESMLKKAGYTTWTGLYYKSKEYKNLSASEFKTAIRKKIAASGYSIIENIGDQNSDLKGGYALAQYKLPNPFYYVP